MRLNSSLIAAELAHLGITVDCVPLLDLPVEGANEIIGDRAFSADPAVTIRLARAQCEALLAGGVLAGGQAPAGPRPRAGRQPPGAAPCDGRPGDPGGERLRDLPRPPRCALGHDGPRGLRRPRPEPPGEHLANGSGRGDPASHRFRGFPGLGRSFHGGPEWRPGGAGGGPAWRPAAMRCCTATARPRRWSRWRAPAALLDAAAQARLARGEAQRAKDPAPFRAPSRRSASCRTACTGVSRPQGDSRVAQYGRLGNSCILYVASTLGPAGSLLAITLHEAAHGYVAY